jgi:hypothetical protein
VKREWIEEHDRRLQESNASARAVNVPSQDDAGRVGKKRSASPEVHVKTEGESDAKRPKIAEQGEEGAISVEEELTDGVVKAEKVDSRMI